MIPIGAIVGPTAVGKSKLGVEVAGLLNGEIVSIDSMQIYKGMDIGTAKIKMEECYSSKGKYIPHHMIDIVSPEKFYSVADFKKEAEEVIKDINIRGKLPILIGGTGLYYNAIVKGYNFPVQSFDKNIRERLKRYASKYGSKHLFEKLKKADPEAAKKIHPNDLKRVIRALEYNEITGSKISSIKNKPNDRYKLASVGLYMNREMLYDIINNRVDRMFDEGFVSEVKSLVNKGCPYTANAMGGLGYKQVIKYLKGDYTLEDAIKIMKRETRRYAKRQLTWFRRDDNIMWYDPTSYSDIINAAASVAAYINQRLQTNNI